MGWKHVKAIPVRSRWICKATGFSFGPFIVGIGEQLKSSFDCVGNYYNASVEPEFKQALDDIVAISLSPTTAQLNILNQHGMAVEKDVHVIFMDRITEKQIQFYPYVECTRIARHPLCRSDG